MKYPGMAMGLHDFYDENQAIDPVKLGPFLYSSALEMGLLFNEITFNNCVEEKSIKK